MNSKTTMQVLCAVNQDSLVTMYGLQHTVQVSWKHPFTASPLTTHSHENKLF